MSHRRHILVLEDFFDRLAIMLWPRFKQIMDVHYQSIMTANVRRLHLPNGSSIDPKTNHYTSRRFAELLSSILHLMHSGSSSEFHGLGIGGGGSEMLTNDMNKLSVAMVGGLLVKLSSHFLRTNRERCVFMANNIFLILSIMQERGLGGDDVYLNETLEVHRNTFVDEEMRESFPRLMKFVNDSEQDQTSASDEFIEDLNREFSSRWRNAVESVYHDVINMIVDKRNGSNLLIKTLRQLLLYYTRYQDVVKRMSVESGRGRLSALVAHELVSSTVILSEIRNYTSMIGV